MLNEQRQRTTNDFQPAGSRFLYPIAAALIVVLALLLRLRGAGSAFLFGDEMWSLRLLSRSYGELVGFFDDVGSGLALPILQKASVDLFGFSLLAVRLPSLIPALATVVLMATTGARVVSRHAALFAAAFLATSTIHLFYSRFGRSYALVGLLAYLYVANLTRILSESRPSMWRYVTIAVAGGLLPWAHVITAPFVAVIGATAVVSALVRREPRPRVIPLLAALGGGRRMPAGLPAGLDDGYDADREVR
jgi:mannosyltransferase